MNCRHATKVTENINSFDMPDKTIVDFHAANTPNSNQMKEYLSVLERSGKLLQSPAPRDKIAALINQIAANSEHRCELHMVADDFAPTTSSFVREDDNGRTPMRRMMVDSLFPLIELPIELYHYTKKKSAWGILNEGKLRLTSLSKRCNVFEGEIMNFVEDFGFPECTQEYENIQRIASSKFYSSFADPQSLSAENEQTLWDRFAEDDGARLKFRVHSAPPFKLRRIAYASGVGRLAKMFKEINQAISHKFEGCKMVFNGWSDFVGFYLAKSDLEYETEVRLLIDEQINNELSPICPADDGAPFIECAIGKQLQLDLLEVVSDSLLPTLHGIIPKKRSKKAASAALLVRPKQASKVQSRLRE